MSGLESLTWAVLGYAALPIIIVSGFIGTALVACFLLDKFGEQ